MHVGVGDDQVEDHCVEEMEDVDRGRHRDATEKGEAGSQRRATAARVLDLRDDAKCLAEVLLMDAEGAAVRMLRAVVAFDEAERPPPDGAGLHRCHGEADGASQTGHEGLVFRRCGKFRDRLEPRPGDSTARRGIPRSRDLTSYFSAVPLKRIENGLSIDRQPELCRDVSEVRVPRADHHPSRQRTGGRFHDHRTA